MFFDAKYAKAGTSGPGDDMVGHVQFGSGVLHDAAGRTVGKFSFTCRWIEILPDGDARERCTGRATTADGRVNLAGPALRNAATHTWPITGGTGRYRGARGTGVVRDINPMETLADFAVTPRRGVKLRTGAIPDPAANRGFRARASARCRDAAKTLSALPPFPFTDFDPLHPDPAVLPDVGRFFTGPHDPRPTYEQLKEELVAMGRPPAQRSAWGDLVVAQANSLQNIQRQDDAALAADVPAFVQTVKDSSANFRDVAIAATVFGVPDCVV